MEQYTLANGVQIHVMDIASSCKDAGDYRYNESGAYQRHL